ncbi:tau 95 subunit of transcription factor TFIIIC [Cladochytrium tenue]|nr:tau 95 subunit of transcription factor TFIIIC [Cladochytrium tenue]
MSGDTTRPEGEGPLPEDAQASQPLPLWTFHAIEFPGRVLSIDAAVESLGGPGEVEEAFAAEDVVLELRLRPSDPFGHPLFGEVISTANLLLKVTRKRRRRRQAGVGGAPDDEGPVTMLVNKQPVPRIPVTNFKKSDENVPSGPTPEIVEFGKILPASAVDAICRLFGVPAVSDAQGSEAHTETAPTPADPVADAYISPTRPIWTLLALKNSLPAEVRQHVKAAVSQVAYQVKFGAWKWAWIRYGYDPRLDPASRMYQVVSMRFVKAPMTLGRARRRVEGAGVASGRLKPTGVDTSGQISYPQENSPIGGVAEEEELA